jgi:Protein of unknown function (DUF3553)
MQVGQCIRNPKKPDWGVGQVIEVNGDKIRIHFGVSGVRTLDTRYVQLEQVDNAKAGNSEELQIDSERLVDLCLRFVREMEGNRSTFDDAGVARRILDEMASRGRLTRTTEKRLAAWCNTEGAVFQAGVPLAREISITIYGRVLREEEFD